MAVFHVSATDCTTVTLDTINRSNGVIYAATTSMPWPGTAAVYVSVVHISKGRDHKLGILDNEKVSIITPLLDSASNIGNPKLLKQNALKSFIGSYILGGGFLITPEAAKLLTEKDPRNDEVIFPYVNGQDINSHPDQSPSRYAINFFDWSLDRAESYPDCMQIVRKEVKPEREEKSYSKSAREKWWQYERARLELYETIKPLQRALIRPRVSDTHAPVFVPKGWIYSEATVVFAFDDYFHFAVMQSSCHEYWVRKYASTLKGDIRYSPSDVFDTFPFPQSPISNLQSLETIGEQYHEHRRQVMLARQEGLTATYNRFHDPACQDSDIAELRRLHIELDQAVLAAYGWSDVTLDHAFRGAGKEARFTLSEGVKEELLRRLLLLNFEIAAGEERNREGTKNAKKKKGKEEENNPKEKTLRPLRLGGSNPRQASLPGLEDDRPRQLGLFGEEE